MQGAIMTRRAMAFTVALCLPVAIGTMTLTLTLMLACFGGIG
jgi:hypothetical protein